MAKLRKMMGEISDSAVVGLMALIETQSKTTLTAWAANYVKTNYAPILVKYEYMDSRVNAVMDSAISYAKGQSSLKELKSVVNDARKAAQELDKMPVVQATVRAIATACAVASTPTNALGFAFYGAAAYAYDTAGLSAEKSLYDSLAHEELQRILDSLQKVAVENEPHPVKVNWNC